MKSIHFNPFHLYLFWGSTFRDNWVDYMTSKCVNWIFKGWIYQLVYFSKINLYCMYVCYISILLFLVWNICILIKRRGNAKRTKSINEQSILVSKVHAYILKIFIPHEWESGLGFFIFCLTSKLGCNLIIHNANFVAGLVYICNTRLYVYMLN